MAVTGFDDRNVLGTFYQEYEDTFAGSYANMLGMLVSSDRLKETHGFLGANPALREWLGDRQGQVLNKTTYDITNKTYEATMEIFEADLEREKTGLLQRRMSAFASDCGADHWQTLLVALINANGTCWDGQTFFSTTHSFGDSGTLLNELTSTQVPAADVATTTAPTPVEMANVILQTVGYMKTWVNDKGKLINGQAKRFGILTSTPALYSATVQAVTGMLLSSSGPIDNPLQGLKSAGFSFEPIMDSRITSATAKIQVYRLDGALKPFILQTEKEIETDFLGKGSDNYFKRKSYLLGVDCRRAVGYGMWDQAARVTLS
jgi:phage major head subunit gpT-like protein